MTSLEPLRSALTNQPFKPFVVTLANGASYPVPHPDFLWIPPRGGTVHIQSPHDERIHIVDVLMIAEISHDAATTAGS